MNAAAIAVLLLAACAGPAAAQQALRQCLPPAEMAKILGKQYSEVVVGWDVTNHGKRLVQHYRSPSGSWTMVVTEAGGDACITAAGKSWRDEPPRAIGPLIALRG